MARRTNVRSTASGLSGESVGRDTAARRPVQGNRIDQAAFPRCRRGDPISMPDTIRPAAVEQLLVGRLAEHEATDDERAAARNLLATERDWYLDQTERLARLLEFLRRFAGPDDLTIGDVLDQTPRRIGADSIEFEVAAARLMADAFPGGIVWQDGGDPRDLAL